MSKKITHEQARQHLENKIKDGNILTVLEYIKQQEELEHHQKHSFVNELSGILYDLKQTEKLLELYKEINNKRKKLITLARDSQWSWILDVEIRQIEDKIKEKEND